MNEQEKKITRDELYEEIWRTPMSKLAATWGTSIASIVKACEKMNVPRPGSRHWALVQRGWQAERSPLSAAEANTVAVAILLPIQKREKRDNHEPIVKEKVSAPKVSVPKNLDNAHRFVKQTRKALTTDTYLHNGFVQTRSNLDQPIHLTVSREQLDRALRVCDAIIKGVLELGGRFEAGPERWRSRIFIGKQAVEFRVREAMKRFPLDMTEEEKKANGYWPWDKYGWKGSGILKFAFYGEDLGYERTWQDSKHVSLEELAGEIIGELMNAEKEAIRIRADAAQRRKQEGEERARQERARQIQEALRKEADRRRRVEEENRMRLEQMANAWRQAKLLRRFIDACEAKLQKERNALPPNGWEEHWLVWAREHLRRVDPMTNGFLEAEGRRLVASEENDRH